MIAKPSCLQLFLSFLRLGATAFGGPSMVATIRKMAVDQKGWVDEEAFQTGVAFCQTIPGAIAMQVAGYVGLRVRGVAGAAASFIGFGLPSFLMMMGLSAIYAKARAVPSVISAFSGLQAIVVALVANATVVFGISIAKGMKQVLLACGAGVLFGAGVHPIVVILLSAFWGLVLLAAKDLPVESTSSRQETFSSKPLLSLLLAAIAGFLLLWCLSPPLFELASLMFRIDLFAFGGGFASIPLMVHEIVEVRHWMDSQTFLNGIVLGQVTPGPIVITTAFVGYQVQGPWGGVVATVSLFLPSFTVVIGLWPYFDRMRSSPPFNRAMGGIQCSFVGLLLAVLVRFAGDVNWDAIHLAFAVAAFIALRRKVDVLWVVLFGTGASVLALNGWFCVRPV